MTALNVFEYAGQEIRTVLVDGEPWFVAADATAALGLRNGRDAVSRIDEAAVGNADIRSGGQMRRVSIINESGLYELIFQSRVPGALEFKRWVTGEVLPAIRRTGRFQVDHVEQALPQSYADALRELAVAVERQEQLEAAVAAAAPKVAAYDQLMDADGFYSMEAVAKLGGIGRTTLFRRLREASVIQSGSTMPYQRWMHHFKITAGSWQDSCGVVHATSTTRVQPGSVQWVLSRAGVTSAQPELGVSA